MIIMFLLGVLASIFCWIQGAKYGNVETIKKFRKKADKLSAEARAEYYRIEKEINGY
jgi:hypothetical protein